MAKTIQNPWITKGVTEFSQKKQKLYEWFPNWRTPQKKITKIVSIFSKQLKRKERKYATPTNYLNALKILKKHEVL